MAGRGPMVVRDRGLLTDHDSEAALDDPPTRGGIQALDTALRLLQVLGSMPGPTGLSDLARRAGMPASKAHRYLASFVKAGLVEIGRASCGERVCQYV